jgi:hypothetical protein
VIWLPPSFGLFVLFLFSLFFFSVSFLRSSGRICLCKSEFLEFNGVLLDLEGFSTEFNEVYLAVIFLVSGDLDTARVAELLL